MPEVTPMQAEIRLAEMICGEGQPVSRAVLETASRHFADLVGVTLAAQGEPQLAALSALLPEQERSPRTARLWGTERCFSPRDAALLNGFAAHFHDFDDDETELAMAHVTVSAMTAAAVVGDSRYGFSGEAVLRAYIAGSETAMRIGRLVNPAHYKRGWHATATLGVFAACAAAGKLMKLDVSRMRHALGMAASFASGIRSNFGTDAKPLQVGQAVANGIFAAECGSLGLESASGSLFGPAGYVALHDGDIKQATEVVEGFGQPYGFSGGSMVIKGYPCCTASHSAISCILSLVGSGRVAIEQISRIRCHLDPAVRGILIYDRPETVAQAKFSLPFALAVAAVSGKAGLADFSESALSNPAVQALMPKIDQIDDPNLPKGVSGISVSSRVVIDLVDCSVLEAFCASVPGSSANPLDDAALGDKFIRCAESLLGSDHAARLFATLLTTADISDFSSLVDAFVPARRAELSFANQR
jgi:2-methylcitrate dehydratase PrpD